MDGSDVVGFAVDSESVLSRHHDSNLELVRCWMFCLRFVTDGNANKGLYDPFMLMFGGLFSVLALRGTVCGCDCSTGWP